MITFGYRSRFNGPIRALTALVIGIIMVVSKANALNMAVRIIAAFLIASGIVSLMVGYRNRTNGTMGLMGFNAGVDIFLGIMVFLFPDFISGLLVLIVGFALLGFGLFQMIALFSANRVLKVGMFSFVMPVLVFLSGAFLVMRPTFIGEAIGVIAGAALIIYGISELLSSWKIRQAMGEPFLKDKDTAQDNEVDEQ